MNRLNDFESEKDMLNLVSSQYSDKNNIDAKKNLDPDADNDMYEMYMLGMNRQCGESWHMEENEDVDI